jgi:DNA-binding NarL/FixJ family response regulator
LSAWRLTARTVLTLATTQKPDVIILDISMLGLNGVKVVERLRAACPASKILLHILPEEKVYLRQLVELGVTGCLLKCSSAAELIGAIRAVARGGFFSILRSGSLMLEVREDRKGARREPDLAGRTKELD